MLDVKRLRVHSAATTAPFFALLALRFCLRSARGTSDRRGVPCELHQHGTRVRFLNRYGEVGDAGIAHSLAGSGMMCF